MRRQSVRRQAEIKPCRGKPEPISAIPKSRSTTSSIGRRRLPQGRPALRRHERPDVRRTASHLEGRFRLESAAVTDARLSTISMWPAAPAISPFAWPRRAGPRRKVTVLDINGDMLEVGRERAEKKGLAATNDLCRGQCRGPAFPDARIRRLYHRLWHSQRAANRQGACGSLSRAQARREVPLPGIFASRGPRAGQSL